VVNRRLGLDGEEEYMVLLPRIEPRILDRPACILVTIPTELLIIIIIIIIIIIPLGRHSTDSLEQTTTMGTAHTMRSVLQPET
jgi:hypothetical protein